MLFSPQVCCHFKLQLDLTSLSSILATASEGEGGTKAGMSMEEVREEVTATADIPPPSQALTLSRVTYIAIDDPSKHSLGTEHIVQRSPDTIVGEHSTVDHTRSIDVQVPSSRTLGLPNGTPLPLNSAVALSEPASFLLDSHSQMLAPTASGPSRSWDPSAAVVGAESVKTGLCHGTEKDEPYNNNTLTSDVPLRQLPLQRSIDVANAGLSRSSLDPENADEHSSHPRGEYDIV